MEKLWEIGFDITSFLFTWIASKELRWRSQVLNRVFLEEAGDLLQTLETKASKFLSDDLSKIFEQRFFSGLSLTKEKIWLSQQIHVERARLQKADQVFHLFWARIGLVWVCALFGKLFLKVPSHPSFILLACAIVSFLAYQQIPSKDLSWFFKGRTLTPHAHALLSAWLLEEPLPSPEAWPRLAFLQDKACFEGHDDTQELFIEIEAITMQENAHATVRWEHRLNRYPLLEVFCLSLITFVFLGELIQFH